MQKEWSNTAMRASTIFNAGPGEPGRRTASHDGWVKTPRGFALHLSRLQLPRRPRGRHNCVHGDPCLQVLTCTHAHACTHARTHTHTYARTQVGGWRGTALAPVQARWEQGGSMNTRGRLAQEAPGTPAPSAPASLVPGVHKMCPLCLLTQHRPPPRHGRPSSLPATSKRRTRRRSKRRARRRWSWTRRSR